MAHSDSAAIYICPKCNSEIAVHPNYITAGIPACVRYDKCNRMEDVCKLMLALRGFSLIELIRAKSNIVKFKRNVSTDHECSMEYETLRKGGDCKLCVNNRKKTVKPEKVTLIRAHCECSGVRKGTKPHVCPHHNFLVCFPKLAEDWDYKLNYPLRPENISPVSGHVDCWFKCPNEGCGLSYDARLSDRVHKHTRCPYCSGNRVSVSNCLASTHPELCKELAPNNTIDPKTVMYGSKIYMKWICGMGHIYESQPPDRLRGHGCPQCNDPHYNQKVGGHDYFVQEANRVHNNKYQYPEEYKGTDTKINIYCLVVGNNGFVHGNFLQRPYSHKQGIGCPKCSSEKTESKGSLHLKSILNDLGFKERTDYLLEQTFKDLIYKDSLRIDICFPFENLVIEYDGEQHFKTSGWVDEEDLKTNMIRDLLKDRYCLNKGINLLRIPYTYTPDSSFIRNIIMICRSGRQLYASYQHYYNEIIKEINISNIHIIIMPIKLK